MDYCKMWMQEIREYVPQKSQPYNDDEDEDEDIAGEEVGTLTGPVPLQPVPPASRSLPIVRHDFGMPMPNRQMAASNSMLYPGSLALSAPATQLSDPDDSLYLAPVRRAFPGSDKATMLDLSLDTNVQADLPFHMSPFVEDASFYEGYQNHGF